MGDNKCFDLDIKGFNFFQEGFDIKIWHIIASYFLVFFLVPFLILTISSYYENVLFLPGNDVGFFEDVPIISIMILFTFIFIISYIFFKKYRVSPKKLSLLVNKNEFSEKKYSLLINNINDLVGGRKKWFKFKFFLHLIFLIITIYFAFSFTHFNIIFPLDTWRFSNYPSNFIIFTIYQIIIGGYFLPAVIWRLITAVFSLNIILKRLNKENAIQLPLLSYDKTGDLKMIGELAFLFYIILFLPLICLVFSIYYWDIVIGGIIWGEGTIGLLFYFPIILILFLFPVKQAHYIMKKSKKIERNEIVDKYRKLTIQENNLSKLYQNTSNIEDLVNLFSLADRIEKMPEWPFDLITIRTVIGSVLLPLVLIALQEFVF